MIDIISYILAIVYISIGSVQLYTIVSKKGIEEYKRIKDSMICSIIMFLITVLLSILFFSIPFLLILFLNLFNLTIDIRSYINNEINKKIK